MYNHREIEMTLVLLKRDKWNSTTMVLDVTIQTIFLLISYKMTEICFQTSIDNFILVTCLGWYANLMLRDVRICLKKALEKFPLNLVSLSLTMIFGNPCNL